MPVADPTQRFSSRVDNYVLYRPGYPPELLQLLRHECGLTPRSVIADLGSGTGILSRLFLENGNRVFGVEPNQAMRSAGEEALASYQQFTSVNGTAETTTLKADSVDFVTAAQAAHWFDRDQARGEIIRILKLGGWLVLIWNKRRTDSTPFLREYEQLLLNYATDYREVRHERTSEGVDQFFAPAPFQQQLLEMRQCFDYAGLEGRLMSSSYAPLAGHPNHEPMIAELKRLFAKYRVNEQVTMEYDTQAFYGQIKS